MEPNLVVNTTLENKSVLNLHPQKLFYWFVCPWEKLKHQFMCFFSNSGEV